MGNRRKDIIGKRYERLVVLSDDGWRDLPSGQRKALWKCQCDCGNVVTVTGTDLQQKKTRSCGCLHLESVTTHGLSSTSEYRIFDGIWQRCYNPNASFYDSYGARGITLEGKWAEGTREERFMQFYEDMGPRPSEYHTIERLDPSKGYYKENCIWTDDMSMQSYNQNLGSNNTSGKTGVSWNAERQRWEAKIGNENKCIFLGRYQCFEDAVSAREKAEIEYYGFIKE